MSFSGGYKAIVVEGSGNGYVRAVCDYVHLNPVRAELPGPKDRLRECPWSPDKSGVFGGAGAPARLDASLSPAGGARDSEGHGV